MIIHSDHMTMHDLPTCQAMDIHFVSVVVATYNEVS